jgi:nucleoside phosphorylase
MSNIQTSDTQSESLNRVIILTSHTKVWTHINNGLKDSHEYTHRQGTIYQVGTFVNEKNSWEIILAEIDSGNSNSAFETERAIQEFDPEAVFFVGLASGIKNVTVGDVVVSNKIYGYESGKLTANRFELRPEVGNSSYSLQQRAQADARAGQWVGRLDNLSELHFPKAVVGPIAAGEKELDGTENNLVEFLRANYEDALAIELEGKGFLAAARANNGINAIVIRGISNLLDGCGASVDETKATVSAVAFLFEMLANLKQVRPYRAENSLVEFSREDSPDKPTSLPAHSTFKIVSLDKLYSVLTSNPSPVIWVGGGTSVKSGIPLSDGLVEKAVRWNYCLEKGKSFDDPRVILRLSDWLPELRAEKWFGDKSLLDAFPAVAHNMLRPHENRREFFRKIVDTEVPASKGCERLAEFMALGFVNTILTTNFDRVLANFCHSHRRPHYVDVIDGAPSYKLLKTSTKHPIIAYLYGTLEEYIGRFNSDEEPSLAPELITRLVPILRDHPIIFIGYRGSEEVLMKEILLQYLPELDNYEHGIYWCVQTGGPSDLHPLVQELATSVQSNFQIVPVAGFDEMMEELWTTHRSRQASPLPRSIQVDTAELPPPKFDLQIIDADAREELDWTIIKARLSDYYDVWEMPRPQIVDKIWLEGEFARQHLAEYTADNRLLPTNAGYLLFGKEPHERVPGSSVFLEVEGEERQEIQGNLWFQLKVILDSLADANNSFLLKGDKSETVYPYPPTALREIVVNALVHRDYNREGNIIIQIKPEYIRIKNPGGLIEDVFHLTEHGAILQQIEQGVRGIKGYRNPVIADFFYSSHDMEKKGSGLADVYNLVRENGGRVSFGPINENTEFEVTIFSRPESIDRDTGTAPVITSTRYAGNLLEVSTLPENVWHATTEFTRVRDVWANTNYSWLPPFLLHGQKIQTFFPLTDVANPLRDLIDTKTINSTPVHELSAGEDGSRKLVWLLNECIFKHFKHCGLIVDSRNKRVYFPRYKEVNDKRLVTYRARLKKSTRTVTKPVISKTTDQIRYWEHQSLTFGLEKFGESWALHLLPGYVFTVDGVKDFLSGERVNRLSTQRASRDYNSKVHTDLIFWSWILSGGKQGNFALQMGPTEHDLSRQMDLPADSKTAKKDKTRLLKNLRGFLSINNQPTILINSVLPTFTVYHLDETEFNEDLDDESGELAALEEEISAIIEDIEERFD